MDEDLILERGVSLEELPLEPRLKGRLQEELKCLNKKILNQGQPRFFMLPSFTKAIGFALMTAGKPFLENQITRKHLAQLQRKSAGEGERIKRLALCYPEELSDKTAQDKTATANFLEGFPYRELTALGEQITAQHKSTVFKVFQQKKDGDLITSSLQELEGVDFLYVVVENIGGNHNSLVCYYQFGARAERAVQEQPGVVQTAFSAIALLVVLLWIAYCSMELLGERISVLQEWIKEAHRLMLPVISPAWIPCLRCDGI